jgi:indolepyruvate ferredoxin oxidoreductase beta subunit
MLCLLKVVPLWECQAHGDGKMSFDIFICGVGGQGLVLLTSVIGKACVKSGKNAITGEMYGLSQRSGTVFVHMRIGSDAYSPLINYGGADVMVSLEGMEALRYLEYLKKGGIILLNQRIMHPPTETAKVIKDKSRKYLKLEDILSRLKSWTEKIAVVDALRLAKDSGNVNAENTVFLGCLSALEVFPVEEQSIKESIMDTVPPKTIEQNLRAFELGKKSAFESICNRVACKKI